MEKSIAEELVRDVEREIADNYPHTIPDSTRLCLRAALGVCAGLIGMIEELEERIEKLEGCK